jgi:hypothetical protein
MEIMKKRAPQRAIFPCIPMLIKALFTITKIWSNEWIKKMWYAQSNIISLKKEENPVIATTWRVWRILC